MKSAFIVAIASAALLVPAGPASGQPLAGGPGAPSSMYLTARMGAFVPRSDDFKELDFAAGIDIEVGAGMQFTPVIAGEFSIGRYATSGKGTIATVDASGTWLDTIDADLEVLSFTATLKAFAPIQGSTRLYGLVGAGVYSADLSGTDTWTWTDGFLVDSGQDSFSESDNPFGLHIGAGVDFPVAPRVRLGVEAKYAIVSPEFFGEKFDANGFRVVGALVYQF